ncbi:MAG: SOS response-associated peptidase [Flaviflexus sp.]|nr:SOS response-associated peptidase [Flaviflexus sp.]
MCGRYASFTPLEVGEPLFELDVVTEEVKQRRPSWNVAPTTMVPIIVQPEAREAHLARWGLIPPWAKDPQVGAKMINARAETVAEKRSFAPSLKSRRCLVVADGYYEWEDKGKPHYIYRADGQRIGFAGLYTWWRPAPDSWQLSTTIITRAADQLAELHHREPVILNPGDFSGWLDPSSGTDDALSILNSPAPSLEHYLVNPQVGRVGVDSEANIEPA